jgi:hypothetical protein
MNAPDAPFPWHMVTFTKDGFMFQSNPHEGNRDESDSSGQGLWERVRVGPASQEKENAGRHIRAKFVEIKADRATGEHIGKGVIELQITVQGDRFTGDSQAYRFDASGKLVRGPLRSSVAGTRVTLKPTVS